MSQERLEKQQEVEYGQDSNTNAVINNSTCSDDINSQLSSPLKKGDSNLNYFDFKADTMKQSESSQDTVILNKNTVQQFKKPISLKQAMIQSTNTSTIAIPTYSNYSNTFQEPQNQKSSNLNNQILKPIQITKNEPISANTKLIAASQTAVPSKDELTCTTALNAQTNLDNSTIKDSSSQLILESQKNKSCTSNQTMSSPKEIDQQSNKNPLPTSLKLAQTLESRNTNSNSITQSTTILNTNSTDTISNTSLLTPHNNFINSNSLAKITNQNLINTNDNSINANSLNEKTNRFPENSNMQNEKSNIQNQNNHSLNKNDDKLSENTNVKKENTNMLIENMNTSTQRNNVQNNNTNNLIEYASRINSEDTFIKQSQQQQPQKIKDINKRDIDQKSKLIRSSQETEQLNNKYPLPQSLKQAKTAQSKSDTLIAAQTPLNIQKVNQAIKPKYYQQEKNSQIEQTEMILETQQKTIENMTWQLGDQIFTKEDIVACFSDKQVFNQANIFTRKPVSHLFYDSDEEVQEEGLVTQIHKRNMQDVYDMTPMDKKFTFLWNEFFIKLEKTKIIEKVPIKRSDIYGYLQKFIKENTDDLLKLYHQFVIHLYTLQDNGIIDHDQIIKSLKYLKDYPKDDIIIQQMEVVQDDDEQNEHFY